MRAWFAALAAFLGCGSGETSCPPGSFVYRDTQCSAPTPSGAAMCLEVGDGRCYTRCTSDGDCPDAAHFCRSLGLFSGGDFSCNSSVKVCRAVDHNDCAG